jgi:uncharacterized membrane protein
MASDADRQSKGQRIYVAAAWASPFSAVVISVALWLWSVNHQGTRGERSPAVLGFYLVLLVVSALVGLAGLISLVGIRSWRNALVIIPGALLGIGVSTSNALMCLLAYALEGKNLGG